MAATTQTQQWPLSSQDNGTRTRRPSLPLTVALWAVTLPTAAMFLMAGSMKLGGAPPMVQMFDMIGVGQWFRYLTGAIEVVSAIALLIPSLALFGALALIPTMVGGILTHVFVIGGSFAVPLTLLLATSFIAWVRFSRR
jgi:putative oxidoreductase